MQTVGAGPATLVNGHLGVVKDESELLRLLEPSAIAQPGYYLQDATWAEFRERHGWESHTVTILDKHRVVFYTRKVPGLGYFCYAPRCEPFFQDDVELNTLIKEELERRFHDAFVIHIEPNCSPLPQSKVDGIRAAGFVESKSNIQHQATVKIDLDKTEEELFSSFNQTARNLVRKAEKNSIVVKNTEVCTSSLMYFYELLNDTRKRHQFYIRDREVLMDYWQALAAAGKGRLYLVHKDYDVLAGAYVIKIGNKAWYKDGGSVTHNSRLGGTTLLQWQIMKSLQKDGVVEYDLCGAAAGTEVKPDDQLYNVYKFKSRFSKDVHVYSSAWKLIIKPAQYRAWKKLSGYYVRLYSKASKDYWY